jgi:hypothetical protein
LGLPPATRLRIAWLLTGIAGLAALLVFRAWTPGGPPTCLMVLVAGVACPGCGMTRATACLAQGDLAASWRLHPLAIVFAAQAVVAWCWWGLVAWNRVRTPSPWWGIVPLSLDILALAVTWLIRWSSGTLPR